MAFLKEQWGQRQVRPNLRFGNGKQRFQVLLAGQGELYGGAIYHLLARQLDLRQQPPDSGMKPENGAHNFFRQAEHPVAALHVHQFVNGNCLLRAFVKI